MNEIQRNKIIEGLLILTAVYLFIIIPKEHLSGINLIFYKSYFFHFIPPIILILSLLNPQTLRLQFDKFDALFLSFIALHFLSFFWATAPSEIWEVSFNWLRIYTLYKIISSLHLKLHYDCQIYTI